MIRFADFSKWQGHINWRVLREAPLGGVYLRASQGLVADPEFGANVTGARSVALRPGAYHFLRPEVDLRKQAQFFFDQHPPLMPTDFDQAVDVEFSMRDGLDEWLAAGDPQHIEDIIVEFLDLVDFLFKRDTVLYCGKAFADKYLPVNHRLGNRRLWLPYYPQSQVQPLNTIPEWNPKYLPNGWADYWAWQYGQVNFPGVGTVDANVIKTV